jgi:hypothetical protein
MERKHAAALVAVIVVAAGGGYLLLSNPVALEHHFEEMITDTSIDWLHFSMLYYEDTNISVSFVNDSTLLYSIDIVLYEPSSAWSAIEVYRPRASTFGLNALARVRSVDIVLGTGIPYSVYIAGVNLNTSAVYDNGALLGHSSVQYAFTYDATGILSLEFTEDVQIADAQFAADVQIARSDVVNLIIDLPDGLDGNVRIHPDTNYYTYQLDGWSFTGIQPVSPRYSTDETLPRPRLEIYVQAETAHLWLSD